MLSYSLPSLGSQANNLAVPTLLRLLNQLVQEVSQVSHFGLLGGPTDPSLVRYQDDHHVYLEAKLVGASGLAADLCVLDGQVFIRVERSQVNLAP